MSFEITPVDPDKMTWTVKADGQEIRPRLLEIDSDWGSFKLGWRPEGYHGWAFKPGKKGAMTFPWAKTPWGELLVGLVHEYRPNMGPHKVWCPLGGVVEKDESIEEAARRESLEEGGIDTKGAEMLPGAQINTDRMYYIMEKDDDWGMEVFSLKLDWRLLEPTGENDLWKVVKGHISHKKESELYFLPWRKAILLSGDALALAGIARLLRAIL